MTKQMEMIAESYLNADKETQEKILNIIPNEDKKAFLEFIGLYKLMTDKEYYNNIQNIVGKKVYETYNK